MKLFATDLDGTLFDREGRIHPEDARAIARAKEQGVIVTIATGRLTSGTHMVARTLELTVPVVCADGGVTACSVTERLIHRHAVHTQAVDFILRELVRRELASFVFTHDTIHSCERGRDHHPYVRGWSPRIQTHQDVIDAPAWRSTPDAAVMVIGIGSPTAVASLAATVREAHPDLDTATFTFGPGTASVLRVLAPGVSKGAALAVLAEQLGVEQKNTAVIGDWLNDLSMFAWAKRSYAMPHAPENVKAAATNPLDEHSCKRGAIACALEDFLAND